jgi:hypothetical protein
MWGKGGRTESERSLLYSDGELLGLLVGPFLHTGSRDDDALTGRSRIDGAILWTPLLTPLA